MKRLIAGVVLLVSAACSDANTPTSPLLGPLPDPQPTRIQIAMIPGELPQEGGTATVRVETLGGSRPAPNVRVSLSADGGTLSPSEVTTDSSGHASATWTGTASATLTATGAGLSTTTALRVTPPSPVIVPSPTPQPAPSPSPAPTPTPSPAPAPPTVPTLTATMGPASYTVNMNTGQNYVATVDGLQAGESVIGYTWEFEAGAGGTATTAIPIRSYTYTTHGAKTPKVTALTDKGRSASATTTVLVLSPLR